jgi:hypothetical protein
MVTLKPHFHERMRVDPEKGLFYIRGAASDGI